MSRWISLVIALVAAGLYAAWVAPLLPWVMRSLSDEDGALRACVVGLGCLLAARSFTEPVRAARRVLPQALLLAAIPPLLAPLFPGLQTVAVLLAVLSGYGLLGLMIDAERWRALRPLALLVLIAVPAAIWIDVIAGWPLRKVIASVAAQLLGGVPIETVIRVEGGIAHVDLPCAGVRSLWMLAAILLLYALASAQTINGRWWLTCALAEVTMIVANTVRVVILVALAHVWGAPLLAQSVHVPLGLIGFAVSLLVGVGAQRWLERGVTPRVHLSLGDAASVGAWRFVPAALALMVAITTASAPAPTGLTTAAPVPEGWRALEPSTVESDFAGEHGASVTKARGPGGASVVMVASGSWLAHHVPEQCLIADGWRVIEDHPAWIDGLPVRRARLARDGQTATAIWWFQRGEQITDDLVVRIRAGGRWVLVSVLIPGDLPEGDSAGFLEPMRRAASGGET